MSISNSGALSNTVEDENPSISGKDQERRVYMDTLMMGIEAIIVTRDVCQLDEASSEEVLQWGLKTLIKGLHCSNS